MRCQKCGYISFDGRLTCSRCGKAFQVLDGLAGTALDSEPPDYLVVRRQETVEEPSLAERVMVAPKTVPAVQAEEKPLLTSAGDSVQEETAGVPELFETVDVPEPELPDEKAGVVELGDLSDDASIEAADNDDEISMSGGLTELSSFDDLLAGMDMETPHTHSQPEAGEQPVQDINDLNLELEQDRENEKS